MATHVKILNKSSSGDSGGGGGSVPIYRRLSSTLIITSSAKVDVVSIPLEAGKKYKLEIDGYFIANDDASPYGQMELDPSTNIQDSTTLTIKSDPAELSSGFLHGDLQHGKWVFNYTAPQAMTYYGLIRGSAIIDLTGAGSNVTYDLKGRAFSGDLSIYSCRLIATEIL